MTVRSVEEVSVEVADSAVTLRWSPRRGAPRVRVLRSREWYPSTPDAAATGLFGSVQVGEGDLDACVDDGLPRGTEFYYAIFAADRHGTWSAPVHVHAWTIADGHAPEVEGDRAAARSSAGDDRRLIAGAVLGSVFVTAYLAVFMTSGWRFHAAVTAAFVLLTVWHLVEGADYELRGFLRWLAVPSALVAAVYAASLVMQLFGRAAGLSLGFVGWHQLWIPIVPLAMIGVWVYTGLVIGGALAGDRLRGALALAFPIVLTAAAVEIGLLLAAVLAVAMRAFFERSLRDPGWVQGAAAAAERQTAIPAATLRRRDGDLYLSYHCPRHGVPHALPHSAAIMRSYAVAREDGECFCPGRAPWFVRLGVHRARALLWMLAALWVLNLLDLTLTWRSVSRGRAVEINSLMRRLLGAGALPSLVTKVGVMTVGVLLIWRLRRHRVMLTTATVLVVLYATVVVYQAVFALTF